MTTEPKMKSTAPLPYHAVPGHHTTSDYFCSQYKWSPPFSIYSAAGNGHIVGNGSMEGNHPSNSCTKSGAKKNLLEELSGLNSICGGKRIVDIWVRTMHQD